MTFMYFVDKQKEMDESNARSENLNRGMAGTIPNTSLGFIGGQSSSSGG